MGHEEDALKVLLMAYECSPFGTSERGVGWGRLLQAARVAETHVITSEKNFAALEEGRKNGLIPAVVRFYTPEPDARLRRLEQKPVLFAYNYTAYEHWQRLALELARTLQDREQFDLVHQVNVCTFREPGYAWQLGIPYIWGPVGGSQNFPARFLTMLSPLEAVKEGMRGISNWISLRLKTRVRAAASAAATVYAANSTNLRDYTKVFGREVELLLETGLFEVKRPDRTRFAERLAKQRAGLPVKPLRLLWVGELQTRKALPILLRALAKLSQDVAFELVVVGEGPAKQQWMAQGRRLGLKVVEGSGLQEPGSVAFRGKIPFATVQAEFADADLFCFTSLRDTSGNVVLEALAAGVPVVCFDHQGARDMVTVECGVKVPVSSPARAVEDWARTLRHLAADPEQLLRLSEGATEQARRFLWDENGDRVNALYQQLARTGPLEPAASGMMQV